MKSETEKHRKITIPVSATFKDGKLIRIEYANVSGQAVAEKFLSAFNLESEENNVR